MLKMQEEEMEQTEKCLLDEAWEKRQTQHREPYSDVVITQCILCLLLALAMAVLNLVDGALADALVSKLHMLTDANWSTQLTFALDAVFAYA